MSVQIVEANSETGGFNFLSQEMKDRLLQEDVKDREIVVISIAGAYREGKSFLLNFFLRHLNEHFVERLPGNESASGNLDFDGFKWQHGVKRVTTGIQMSSDIFKYDYENGRQIAIILLDTQGVFDNQTTINDCIRIFALSSLLSSVQIFNVMQKIKETDLQHLQLFAGFGKFAANNNASRPFQRLMFLVRDWCNNSQFQYGFNGGREYIQTHVMNIQPGQQREHKLLREDLKSSFEDIDCFLMPDPGKNFKSNPEFNGQLRDIDQDFLDNVDILVTNLLNPRNLKVKKVFGQPVKASEYIEYFERYFATLNNKNGIPVIQSIYEVNSEIHNQKVFRKCQQLYADKMNRTVIRTIILSSGENEISSDHEISKREVKVLFHSTALLGTTSATKLQEKLDQFVESSLEGFLKLYKTITFLKTLGTVAASVATTAAYFYLLPEAPGIVSLILGYLANHVQSDLMMNYILAYFMNYYEIYRTPSALTDRDEFTEQFWQNRFGRTENPGIQQGLPAIEEGARELEPHV